MSTVVKRVLLTLLLLQLSSLAVFAAIRLSGGDVTAARLPASATAEDRELFREQIGLNQPILTQYVDYLGKVVRGDLGNSLTNNAKISTLAVEKIRNSLILGGAAIVLVFGIGIPLGMLAAFRRNTWLDTSISSAAVAGMAIPNFWLALLVVWLFSSTLGWFPPAGAGGFKYLVLPALVLAAEGIALTVRMTRSAMLENVGQDFVRTLRAAGLSESRVYFKHVLRNSLLPIISLAGLRVGQIIGYALVVETIFGWPGVGQILVNGVLRRDYPIVQFFSLLLVIVVTLGNLAASVGYTLANPRLRK
ncbi:MAG: ABC transporter permease [Acidobacteria bacterium]|nr:ABC transporter permease [Acidobacteriota bacterium]